MPKTTLTHAQRRLKEKTAEAQAIRKQHPDWTWQRCIKAAWGK